MLSRPRTERTKLTTKHARLDVLDGDAEPVSAPPPRPHPGYEPGRVSVLFADGFDEPLIRDAVGPFSGRVAIERLQADDGFAVLAVPRGEEDEWIDRMGALEGVRCCSRTVRD